MHPRLFIKLIDKRKREQEERRITARRKALAFGVIESIARTTGHAPTPASVWPSAGSFVLGVLMLVIVLTFIASRIF